MRSCEESGSQKPGARNQTSFHWLLASGFWLVLLTSGGCWMLGAVASKTVGEPDIPAKYVPNPKEPMLVIAENWGNPTGNETDSEQLAQLVHDDLTAHNVAPQVDPMRVAELKNQHGSTFHTMTVAEIGRWVGAQQVLYINISESSVTAPQGVEFLRGKCVVRVKMIDVESGHAFWPQDMADGFPIDVQTPVQQGGDGVDEATVKQNLHQLAAVKIARLFYKREPDPDGE